MKKLLGLHCLGDWHKYISHIGLWKPPVVTILSPNADQAKEVKERSPNTIVVGRLYKDDHYYNEQIQSRPLAFAREINEEIKRQHTSNIDYWQSVNEPTPYWDKLPNLKKFTHEWMRLADQSGYKCAILAWSVGNPDLPQHDPMIYWKQFIEELRYAQAHNHIVMVHQYNKPNLINHNEMDNWLIFRLEKQVIPNLPSMGLANLKFVIGELGIDHLIANGNIGGFQKTPLSDEQYVAQLLEWETYEQAYAHYVIGSCIYTLGTQPPWDSYSISSNSNVISLLSTYYVNNSNKYDDHEETYLPYVPNEGNEEMSDLQWDSRLTARGTKYELYNPKPNEGYYKLIKGEYLDEKEHIFVNVLDKDGNHQYGVVVTIQWDTDQANIRTENKSNDPYALADANFPMKGHSCSYTIRIGNKNDKVLCEGLGSPERPDWNIHRSGRYTFQWVENSGNVIPEPTPDPLEPVETYLPYIPNPNQSGTPATVSAVSLNVRYGPSTSNKIVARIKEGSQVFVSETKDGFAKVGNNAWVSNSWIKYANTPSTPLPNPDLDSKTLTIREFKNHMARILDINPKVVDAILQVESGNRYYNEFGKPIIRTELHLVQRCLNANVFNRHFRILGPKLWEGHEYRENENQPWKKFHGGELGGGQAAETKVHELVKSLNRQCAFESMSMGAPQILGSNYKMLGYNSAEEMYNDFAKSEAAQIAAMFDYITDSGGWAALLNNDFRAFAASYNGPGQADYYARLIQNYINTH